MLDEYLWGDVERVSPEAPVPVVHVQRESVVLGGAGNVVRNAIALGARVRCLRRRSATTRPASACSWTCSKELGVDPAGVVRVEGRPTTRKTRVDRALPADACASTARPTRRCPRARRCAASQRAIAATPRAGSNGVILEDYGKGLLTPDARARRDAPLPGGAACPWPSTRRAISRPIAAPRS